FRPAPGAAERVAARHGLRRPYFLYVGALDVRKSPLALLRAAEVARAAGADLDLVLAGAGGPQAPERLPGATRLGYLAHEELVDLYSAATCLVFPSRYEGFGLPLLEAMACGCPVVAYRNSSLPEVTGDAALLVADGDVAALGAAAASVAAHAGLRERMRVAGLGRARLYTWRRSARATVAAYERVQTAHGARAATANMMREP
ncbi:MAG: glycosyltransferase family 4 protein, partial [Candidatus Dormibacteraeota bacterium]|nr:glycosyltransferase family 4 protein [Candidatus Dormibacteraeota bacterium]